MKTEKLSNPYVRGNEGCSVSMIDLLEKINEIIDAMNGEHEPDDIYSEDGRLIAKKDESEDERIRKWLVDYFGSIKETVWIHRDITCGQILSWLEKQKENPKNAISIPADCASNAKCPYKIHGDEDFIGDIKDTPAYHFGFDEGVRSEREMQKEQKPAWSEEDERRIDAICELLENTSAIHPNYSRRKLIIWLKSLRPSWKPSEEQMEELNKVRTLNPGLDALYQQLKNM